MNAQNDDDDAAAAAAAAVTSTTTVATSAPTTLFPLGRTFLTIGARDALREASEEPDGYFARHQSGDWGTVCADDRRENDFSVKNGLRILSAYMLGSGEKIWVITEADRSYSTILLPEEY